MLNTTILSLNLFSIISTSPIYSIYNSQKGIRTSLVNSQISRSFTNIIYSSIVNHQTILMNDIFSHTLSSVINLNSNDINTNCSLYPNFKYSPNSPIGGEIIYKEHSYFTGGCGNITITGCIFNESTSNSPGGAIYIEQKCTVIIHNTTFNNCSSNSTKGGACFIAEKKSLIDINFDDTPLPEMDVQYCCFQNCYGVGIINLYGVAIFSSATKSILYYTSTVNCPGQNGRMVKGAQFDLQATNVKSQFVNATGAHSYFCGGIEYRRATEGFFKFQTISSMTCRFAVSYTDIQTKNLNLYDSNIMNITLVGDPPKDDPLYPGLIHVRYTKQTDNDIIIQNFCFINNIFKAPNSTIISKGTLGGNISDYSVILINCSYDCSENKIAVTEYYLKTPVQIYCHPNTSTLNNIAQLDLGECKGKVTAAPLTPSPSYKFTESKFFTHSKEFTPSKEFTRSKAFTSSQKLNTLPPTNAFTGSNHFTHSSEFSSSSSYAPIVHIDQNQGGSNKIAIIAGAASAAAAAVAAAITGTVFFLRKNPTKVEDLQTINEGNTQTKNSNPLYDQNAEEDPFRDDFQQ